MVPNLVRVVVVAGTVMAALVIPLTTHGAVSAKADLGDYLYDLTNAGIGGPQSELESLGLLACAQAGSGVPRENSLDAIQLDTRLSAADAGFLYDSARHFLCP